MPAGEITIHDLVVRESVEPHTTSHAGQKHTHLTQHQYVVINAAIVDDAFELAAAQQGGPIKIRLQYAPSQNDNRDFRKFFGLHALQRPCNDVCSKGVSDNRNRRPWMRLKNKF